jgi:alpha-tubulin suppressor-like RCC1 family protein
MVLSYSKSNGHEKTTKNNNTKSVSSEKRNRLTSSKRIVFMALTAVLLLIVGSIIVVVNFQYQALPEVQIIDKAAFRPTSPENNIEDPETGLTFVAGELIIVTHEDTSQELVEMVISEVGGELIGAMLDIGLFQVKMPSNEVDVVRQAIEKLQDNEQFLAVFPNYVAETNHFKVDSFNQLTLSQDFLLADYHKKNTIYPNVPQWQGDDLRKRWGQLYIDLPKAWRSTVGSGEVKIAVIDTGFDATHPDLQHIVVKAGNPKFLDKLKEKINWPSSQPLPLSHGNAVAGIIGASVDNEQGIAGIMWDLKLYGYFANALTDYFDVYRAAAIDQVDVINISLSWIGKDETLEAIQDEIRANELDAIKHIHKKFLDGELRDILLVVGAGNNPNIPVEYSPLQSLAATHDNVITVGGIDRNGQRWKNSTWGEAVSVAAPAESIWSTVAVRNFPFGRSYEYNSGTSLAAPFVTGVVGLMLSIEPELSPMEIKQIIMDTATHQIFDRPLGTGVVNADKALAAVASKTVVKPMISSSSSHVVALKDNGTVWTWGYNSSGKLGDGSVTNKDRPVQVHGLNGIEMVSAGFSHSLAVKLDGTVWGWGSNAFGQIGDGTKTDRYLPVQISGLDGVQMVSAGNYHSLSLDENGSVWVWGDDSYGVMGTGFSSSIPIRIPDLKGITMISAGDLHSLALKNDGTVWGWGSNEFGQIGNPAEIGLVVTKPIQVKGISDVKMIKAGGNFRYSLALKNDGSVWAWGNNHFGQLGDGTTTNSPTPVKVKGLSDVIAISAGHYHSLALKADGSVWAWGANMVGQLGDGSTSDKTTPVRVVNLDNIKMIVSGVNHSIALEENGNVWAWGGNVHGQLGTGSTEDSNRPVQCLIFLNNHDASSALVNQLAHVERLIFR